MCFTVKQQENITTGKQRRRRLSKQQAFTLRRLFEWPSGVTEQVKSTSVYMWRKCFRWIDQKLSSDWETKCEQERESSSIRDGIYSWSELSAHWMLDSKSEACEATKLDWEGEGVNKVGTDLDDDDRGVHRWKPSFLPIFQYFGVIFCPFPVLLLVSLIFSHIVFLFDISFHSRARKCSALFPSQIWSIVERFRRYILSVLLEQLLLHLLL